MPRCWQLTPPIEHRLKAIDPTLPVRMKSRLNSGALTVADEQTPFTSAGANLTELDGGSLGFSGANNNPATQATPISVSAKQLKDSVGTVTPAHVEEATSLYNSIPETLLTIAHTVHLADCVIYGLILTTMTTHGKPAIKLIEHQTDPEKSDCTKNVYYLLRNNPESIHLPLLDIAIASLAELSAAEQAKVVGLTHELVALDDKFTLYEFIYLSLVEKNLTPKKPKQRQITSYQSVENAIAVLLAATVLAGGNEPQQQQQIFTATMKSFSNKDYAQLLVHPPALQTLSKATSTLNRLSPLLKQPLIDACVDCILHDDSVTPNEANLLRALCERLDCPMPLITAKTSTSLER